MHTQDEMVEKKKPKTSLDIGVGGSKARKCRMTFGNSGLVVRDRIAMTLAAGSVPTDAEIFMKAVGDLLTKRDPMRKAERAAAKHGPKGSDVGSRTNTVENNDAAVATPNEGPTIAAARQRPIRTCIRMDLAARRR